MHDNHGDASRNPLPCPHRRTGRLTPDAHGLPGLPRLAHSRGGATLTLALQDGAARQPVPRGPTARALPALTTTSPVTLQRTPLSMSDIAPIGRGRHAQPARPHHGHRLNGQPHPFPHPSHSTPHLPVAPDRVELSDSARLMSRLTQTSDVRNDLVASVRAMIRAGTYETPEKLDAAAEKLLADLA